MERTGRLRCDIRWFAAEYVSFPLRVNFQACLFGLAEYPLKCELRKLALCLRLATTDVRMHAREPNLFDVLIWICIDKQILTIKCPALVN